MASFAAPPRPIGERKGILSRGNFLGFVNVEGAQHFLKLRHNWKASDAFRLEYGIDFDINRNNPKPWAGCRLLLDGCKEDSWAVEFNTDWAVVCTPKLDLLGFTRGKFSLPVDLKLGTDFFNNDAPHVEVGLYNPKVAITLLAISLAAKQPINIKRKETGGFSVGMPVTFVNGDKVPHTLSSRAEIDATLQRVNKGLSLQFHQLNAVLRMSQD